MKKMPTLVRAGNYWDGLAAEPLGYAEILIEDGVIVEVGKKIMRPTNSEVIDLTDDFVMPGLIDCHVHLTCNSTVGANFASVTDAGLTLAGVDACKKLLHNGFTTVRDAGDFSLGSWVVPDLKRAVTANIIEGPRIICGGHMLSAVCGHFDFSGIVNNRVDLHQVNVAEGVVGLRRAVHQEILRGADWIKFAASGGFGSPSDGPEEVAYSQEEMTAIVMAARDMGKMVFAHAYGDEAVRRSAVAGVRSVEHANLSLAETLNVLVEKGIYVVPTQHAVVSKIRDVDDDALWPDPVPRRKARAYHDRIMECAQNVASSDVKIAFGTDLGTFDYSTNGAVEFSEMVRNGIATLRALKAATSVAAEMLQLQDRGCIAAGKLADIVAMPGNPFEDVSVTEKVNFVMKQGIVYRRNS